MNLAQQKELLGKVPFTLEELTELSRLFKEPSFKLWLRYQALLEEHLNEKVWASKTLEELHFAKGQRDALQRMKKAPLEVEQMREALNQQFEESKERD